MRVYSRRDDLFNSIFPTGMSVAYFEIVHGMSHGYFVLLGTLPGARESPFSNSLFD